EARSRRLADSGGADLLGAAGVMSVVNNQHEEMQDIYVRFTQTISAILFVLAGLLVLPLLDPVLAAYLSGLLLCTYLLTVLGLKETTALIRNWLVKVVASRRSVHAGRTLL